MRILLCFLFISYFGKAQTNPQTPVKFTISEVVKADSILSYPLIKNAEEWVNKHRYTEVTAIGTKIIGSNSFLVYKKGIVSKQVHGRIDYKVNIEVKDFKYKVTFTDFVFNYYAQDRNYNIVPTGKKKPLEDSKATGWQNTWVKHKTYTNQQIQILLNDLKASMLIIPLSTIEKVNPAVDDF